MKQYKTVNNLVGWITFLIAATVYCMTIEPTASFWDCPEFITTGYKLEVGHPPGAPFFMLVANLFSQLCFRCLHRCQDGELHERADERRMYPVPFLEHHAPGTQTCGDRRKHITRGQMVTIMGSGLVGRTCLHVQRYLLVQRCGRSRCMPSPHCSLPSYSGSY